MIDRINGVTPRPYGDVSKLNNQRGGSGSAGAVGDSAFQDTYGGVIYEPSGQVGNIPQGSAGQTEEVSTVLEVEELGVKLDLSPGAVTTAEPKREVIEESLTDVAKRVFHSAITAVKDFFRSIWEGTDGIRTVSEAESSDRPAGDTFINKASAERLTQLLAQNNRGKLAKNSDLLTYYDRSGRIIAMDPTDKNKILSGVDRTIRL